MNISRLIVFLVMILNMTGCGSAPVTVTYVEGKAVINMGERFSWFWKKASKKSFDERVELWNEYIEGKYKHVYDSMIWQKATNPNWEQDKIQRLKVAFELYENASAKIVKTYEEFPVDLKQLSDKFKKKFPDATLQGNYFLLPFAIDSKIAFVTVFPGLRTRELEPLFVSGPDMLTLFTEKKDIILTHELFHVYHMEKMGIEKYLSLLQDRSYKFVKAIYMEGLAEWATMEIQGASLVSQTNLELVKTGTDYNLDDLKVFNTTPTAPMADKSFLSEVKAIAKNKNNNAVCHMMLNQADVELKHITCDDAYDLGKEVMGYIVKKVGLQRTLLMELSEVKSHVHKYFEERREEPKIKELLQVL